MIRGPMTHLKHIFSYERLPFSLLYFGSLIGTLWFSIFAHSYIFSILFVVLQIAALVWVGRNLPVRRNSKGTKSHHPLSTVQFLLLPGWDAAVCQYV